MRSTHNAWIHAAAFLFVLYLGWHFHVTQTEWMFLIVASGLVFITEAVNTAIEIDIDLTSPDEHPYARDTKDVAAGAVLISVFVACAIGATIFLPYLFTI
jgi:diacylglycerol kinase